VREAHNQRPNEFVTYDDWNPIWEWDASGNAVDANIYGAKADEIIGQWNARWGFLFYKQDQHGNVTFLLDQSGGIREKYSYDAFGKPTILSTNNTQLSTSAYGNRFMYTGREWLGVLGIYDYRHRMYHPALGRFLQMDPTGFDAGDMNLFRYCDADPIDRSDPTGLMDMWGNLHSFFTGNPSMNLVLAVWNDRLLAGWHGVVGMIDAAKIDTGVTPIPNPRTQSYANAVWEGETDPDKSMTREQIKAEWGGDGAATTATYPEPTVSSYNGKPMIIQPVKATKHLPKNVSLAEYNRLNGIEDKSVKCIRSGVPDTSLRLGDLVKNVRDANVARDLVRQNVKNILERETLSCRTRADAMGDNANP